MITFGLNLTGFSVMNYFSRHADNFLIGKIYGPLSLGLYTKAYSLLLLPINQINFPIATVAIPALSRLRESPELYKKYYMSILEKLALITIPFIVFLIITSDWVILLILGPQWIDAAKIFAALGIGGLVQPVANTTGWLFISQDRTNEQFKWGIIGSILTILSFVAGLPWGALGVAASYSLSGLFLRTPLLLWIIGRKGPVKTTDFYKAMVFPVTISLLLVLSLVSVRGFIKIDGPLYGIGLLLAIGLIITAMCLLSMQKGRETIKDFKNIVSNFR
jgi:PST family polysaccharide transporter